VKKLLSFLGYLPVILVGTLGAYIVFHMWELSEINRGGHSGGTSGNRHPEQTASDGKPSVIGPQSEEAKTSQSPRAD
jgi:hypothetical protein